MATTRIGQTGPMSPYQAFQAKSAAQTYSVSDASVTSIESAVGRSVDSRLVRSVDTV